MLGSPSTFLPRTLFSEDDADSAADTDAQTEEGWDRASEAMRKAQRPPRSPSDSFSSDDEDGPLHWSSFHAQIESLLKTVQKPGDNRQFPEDGAAFGCQLDSTADAAAARGSCGDAASDSSADELLAYMTGDTASRATPAPKQTAHSEVYGHPLPSWLYELATTTDGGAAPSSHEELVASGQLERSDAAAQMHDQTPGRKPLGSASVGPTKAVPEWLTSPARPAQPAEGVTTVGAATQLPEAMAHPPFKSLIEEIEANLAAGCASLASTSFLYSDDAPGTDSLHWFTNELAKAAAEDAQVAAARSPTGGSSSGFGDFMGGKAGQEPAKYAGCCTPPRSLQLFEDELAEMDPLAEIPTVVNREVDLEGAPAHQAEVDVPGSAATHNIQAGGAVGTEAAGVGSSPAARWTEAGGVSPVHRQDSGNPVAAYRILRPSVSPRSAMQPQSCADWAFLSGQPASQEKGEADASEASSCCDKENCTEAVHMLGGRRVLGELQTISPFAQDPLLAAEAGKPRPEIKVFVDEDAPAKPAAVAKPEEANRLTAVYAQIDALSRDLRGTHDELEQLRHAEAQLQGIYEGLAQSQVHSPGGIHSATGPAHTPEWGPHISQQQVVELEAAKWDLARRLDALAAELEDKDARLARITTQLHHAREQLAAKQREADVLLGETLGLQDVLTEAGAEAAATAAQLAALQVQLERSQARVQEVEEQLAEREAELAQCRGQLRRTEQLLEKARQAAAAKQAAADAAAAAPVSMPALAKAGSPAAKPAAPNNFSFAAGEAAGAGGGRVRPSSAEELSRAMVTPPLAERRRADREGSVGLTPPFTPSLDPTQRSELAFHNIKSPAWAAATPVLRLGRPFAAHRPGTAAGGRSAWDVPSPSPMASSASNAALASVLAAIRTRESHTDREKEARAEQTGLPDTPLASVLRRINSNGRNSMDGTAVV